MPPFCCQRIAGFPVVSFYSLSRHSPFHDSYRTADRPCVERFISTKNVIIVIIVIISSFGFDLHLLGSSKELKNFRPGYSVDPPRSAPWLLAVAHISVSRRPNGHTYSSYNSVMIFEAHLDSFSANSAFSALQHDSPHPRY